MVSRQPVKPTPTPRPESSSWPAETAVLPRGRSPSDIWEPLGSPFYRLFPGLLDSEERACAPAPSDVGFPTDGGASPSVAQAGGGSLTHSTERSERVPPSRIVFTPTQAVACSVRGMSHGVSAPQSPDPSFPLYVGTRRPTTESAPRRATGHPTPITSSLHRHRCPLMAPKPRLPQEPLDVLGFAGSRWQTASGFCNPTAM